jgi:hypothetical protein
MPDDDRCQWPRPCDGQIHGGIEVRPGVWKRFCDRHWRVLDSADDQEHLLYVIEAAVKAEKLDA